MNRTKRLGLSLLALLCCIFATAQSSVTKGEYWFDQQFDSRQTIALTGESWDTQLDLSAMTPGLHRLAIRCGTDDGQWSAVMVKHFLVPQAGSTQENNLSMYEYWIDREFDKRISGSFAEGGVLDLDIDMTSLSPGLHNISVRVLDDNGNVSPVIVKYFLIPQAGSTQENTLAKYEYWIDREFDKRINGSFAEGGVLDIDIDMTSLSPGLHNISVRALDDNGNVSPVIVKHFLIPQAGSLKENGLTTYRYWFDRNLENMVEGTIGEGGLIDIDLDVSNLVPGIHRINYQVQDEQGNYSATMVKYFEILEGVDNEGNTIVPQIVAYEYWFKDNPRKRVEVEPTSVLTIDDTELLLEGVEPETVLPDYVFDVTTKNVVYTQDINFGLQVFNNLGTGSAAVTQTIEGYQTIVDTRMQTLVHEIASTLAAPTGSKVQGYQFNCSKGDRLYWFMDLAEGTTVDFYDANGEKIDAAAIDVETVGDKQARTITTTTTAVYALVYGATADEGQNTIRVVSEETTGIKGVRIDDTSDGNDVWYTLGGQRLSTKPLRKGVYIRNGRKVMVR